MNEYPAYIVIHGGLLVNQGSAFISLTNLAPIQRPGGTEGLMVNLYPAAIDSDEEVSMDESEDDENEDYIEATTVCSAGDNVDRDDSALKKYLRKEAPSTLEEKIAAMRKIKNTAKEVEVEMKSDSDEVEQLGGKEAKDRIRDKKKVDAFVSSNIEGNRSSWLLGTDSDSSGMYTSSTVWEGYLCLCSHRDRKNSCLRVTDIRTASISTKWTSVYPNFGARSYQRACYPSILGVSSSIYIFSSGSVSLCRKCHQWK
ncbi:putative ATP-dependent RNA helicase ddx27 [Parelaphostrongylus tenuis]|uniref:ATP-dependent RNA helicase ddx27 n=1 Tax=Parelaphostrongylus tenuis TaxID=148309 RepID=A0AAD5N5Q4_PARTN|nr:putative ATP-dependent RNA helicase ddx27 [Parelaphostrongylus tenuis]